MEDNKVVILLNSIKQQVGKGENIGDLDVPICAIESVLIRCQLDVYPFMRHLKEIEVYFHRNDHSVYDVGILVAKKMVSDLIDSIISHIETFGVINDDVEG